MGRTWMVVRSVGDLTHNEPPGAIAIPTSSSLAHTHTQITRSPIGCTLRRQQLSSLIFFSMTHMRTHSQTCYTRNTCHTNRNFCHLVYSLHLTLTSTGDLAGRPTLVWSHVWEYTCASGYKISHASGKFHPFHANLGILH